MTVVEISGTSPERTRTVSASSTSGSAARIAPPVPSGSGCSTVSTSSGSPAERSRPGETIAATRPAPASRAARIGQATIARPQTGWSIFGVEERIRVPSPAAMTRTKGGATDSRLLGRARPRRIGAPAKRRDQVPRESSLPTEATLISVQPAKIRSMPTSRPIAQSALEGN